MKLKSVLLFICISCFQFVCAQDLNLSFLTIPDSLSQNANSVVRFYDMNIDLISQRSMRIRVKKAITVLNKLGNHESEVSVHYDKSRKIKSLKAIVYNAIGMVDKKVSKNDFKDYSAGDGFSLFNDGRVRHYEHIPTSYPYTFYYEYEIETTTTAFIPSWFPQNSYTQSVQKSSFTIKYPNDINLQNVEKNLAVFYVKKRTSDHSLLYTANNLKAIKYEILAPPFPDIAPYVKLASNKFHLEGVDGTANTWSEFGKWMYDNLIASRTALSESTKNKVQALVKHTEDPIEKAKIIYEFVQNKTRYISIQVGIGGWMPMLADDVDRLSYGDCKALTNYTKSLMDAAGVESYYSAVFAGDTRRNMEKDVVSVQGNHVILYVPTKEKDVWLECTSQTTPFGYQGTFTDDRDVLVITPEGGKLKHTGVYKDENSYQKTTAAYTLDEKGNIKATIKIRSAGIQYDNHYSIEKKSKREVEDRYKSDYWNNINNLSILNYGFKNNKDEVVFEENVELSALDYGAFSGDRMLFAINAFNQNSYVPKRYRNRKLPMEVARGYIDSDTFEINLPEQFEIEAIADAVKIETKFGSYKFSIEKTATHGLKYSRTLLIKKGSYTNKDFTAYRSFRRKVAKYDKTKVVLIKK